MVNTFIFCRSVYKQAYVKKLADQYLGQTKSEELKGARGEELNVYFDVPKLIDQLPSGDTVSYVLVIGGDGTLNYLLNSLFQRSPNLIKKIKFVLLGHGSGNDLLFYLKRDKRERHEFEIFPVKCSVDNKKTVLSVNSCSAGLTSNIVSLRDKIASKLRFLGGASYYLSLILSIFTINRRLGVEVENNRIETSLLIFMNGGRFGNGIPVMKESNLFSKSFSFFYLENISWVRLVVELLKAILFGIEKSRFIVARECESLNLVFDKPTQLEYDGECIEIKKELTLSALNQPMTVLI